MYELMVESQFSAAHQLRNYKGKCENMHGHNWKIQVVITADRVNEIGLAIDFHKIKQMTDEVLSALDHLVINEVFPFTEINPSSENIAKWLYDSLGKKITREDINISAVTVWESDTASATYYE